MQALGDRMKQYELVSCYSLTRRSPVIVRVDGRAFHTWCKGLATFDTGLMNAMQYAAMQLTGEMQGFKAAYIQSDEVSFLLTDYDTVMTEPWFGYSLAKIVSTSASVMSVEFNEWWQTNRLRKRLVTFDARAFNVPVNDVANYFLWRMQDWERNSLMMYARSFFSHKKLHEKGRFEVHEMLHRIGKNWTTDLSARKKNGTWLIPREQGIGTFFVEPSYAAVSDILHEALDPVEDTK